jgi:hypothetical protein
LIKTFKQNLTKSIKIKTMKTNFKLLGTITTLLFSVSFSNAQTTTTEDDVTLSIGAKILKPIVLTKVEDIQFGPVAAGTLPYLSAIPGTSNQGISTISTSVTIGEVLVDATYEESISVSFPLTVTLTNGTDDVFYVPQATVVSEEANGVLAGAVYMGSSSTITSGVSNPQPSDLGLGTVSGTSGFIRTIRSGSPVVEVATMFFGGWLAGSITNISNSAAPTLATNVLPTTLSSGEYTGTMLITMDYLY